MEALGIDPKLLIAQIINFAILLILLRKFLYKPVISMLEERKKKIDQGLKDSATATKSLKKAEDEAEQIREKAYKEANDILENAKKESSQKANDTITKANQQAELIRKHAAEEALTAKEKALGEAKSQISELVILGLHKIVGEEISAEDKQKLTAKAIKEL